jgi:hypothetical protein
MNFFFIHTNISEKTCWAEWKRKDSQADLAWDASGEAGRLGDEAIIGPLHFV